MSCWKNILVLLFFSILFSFQNLFSQNRPLPNVNNTPIFSDNFFAQIYAMPNSTFDSLNIIFFYSFAYNDLVFQKNTNNDGYFAVPDLEATFKDNDGITRKRIITRDTVFAENFELTSSKHHNISNFEILTLGINDYKVLIRFGNSRTSRAVTLESVIKNYDLLAKENIVLSPFFLKPTTNKNNYQPFIVNNYIPFSAPSATMFFPISYNENSVYNYKIERKREVNNRRNVWGNFSMISGTCELIESAVVTVGKDFDVIELTVGELTADEMQYKKSKQFGLLKLDVSLANFTPANYTVTINTVNKNSEKSNSEEIFDFEVRWNEMPFSLANTDFAIEQMYLILTDTEYKKIRDGNINDRFNNLLEFWKQKDPTPATEYNEAMTEYFRRVDYALSNFQTITQRDGAKTDMGKVHILNGKPDTVTNAINNKISREIWIYDRLKKIYIFELASVGLYKLIKIEDII